MAGVRAALCAVALSAAAALPASAQSFEPVIVVNEKAITEYELDQRARLLAAFGAGGDVRALAREQLIDDRLKMEVAERLELELSDEELQAGLDEFAARRELTVDQVELALQARGIAQQTLLDFLEAGLSWRNVVRALFRARATPSESDLDAALEFANSTVRESVLLQEIALPFADRGEDETEELARQLSRDLNRGGNFGAAVSRYSQAASARRGGRLDWLPAAGLPPAVAAQVLALMPGEVTAPIPIPGGLTIIKLLDIREDPVDPGSSEQTVTYSQLIIPLAANAPPEAVAAAEEQARSVQGETEFCTDIDARAGEFGVGSGRSDPTPLNAVPDNLAMRLAGMDSGQIEIFRDGRGVILLMLCGRSGEVSPEDREALRNRLFNQRMNAFSQGYLQELRGDAVITEK